MRLLKTIFAAKHVGSHKPPGTKKTEKQKEDKVAEGIVKVANHSLPASRMANAQVKDTDKGQMKKPVGGSYGIWIGRQFMQHV